MNATASKEVGQHSREEERAARDTRREICFDRNYKGSSAMTSVHYSSSEGPLSEIEKITDAKRRVEAIREEDGEGRGERR